ncbi:MAG: hypothetical protein Q7T82_10650 [Armatimonadota bacterium]|nr:hypothetical protein [Armatimonadota bacterium]
MTRMFLIVVLVVFAVTIPSGASAGKKPICRSKSDPMLLSFQGNDSFKLIGYDFYDLLNTNKVPKGLDWITNEADRKKPSYEPFFDMLKKNGVNFTRCFVWDGWANDLFCWKRMDSANDPVKQGERYALVDLSQFDDRFWTRARKALEYASKKGVVVEVTLYDRCGVDSDSISPHRWSFHPWNPDNSVPGTIGSDLVPRGMERGIPHIYDIKNPKIKGLHEAYLRKWVEETKGLDNVIFEIENEGYVGYEFNSFVAKYLRNELKCSFLIAVNTFDDKDECHAIPEVDIIADHGPKSPVEVDKLLADWSKFGKVIVVDTDGWRTSEESYDTSLRVAQRALDKNMHYNHKARSIKPCGDTGKRYVELMADLRPRPKDKAVYRLRSDEVNRKIIDITLDDKNLENGLKLDLQWDGSGDGWTKVVERQGKNGRVNTNGPRGQKGRSIYFDVDDGYVFKGDRPKVVIEVDYYDDKPGELVLEYDAVGDNDFQHKTLAFNCKGTTDWQRATWRIEDAYFGNRCGTHADFGVRRPDGSEIVIRQVRVEKLAGS